MSTTETTAQSKTATEATSVPEHEAAEMMPPIEPLQMSQIDMLKIAPTRDERLFLVLSIFIGIISGLLVVSFRVAINWIQALTLGSAPQAGLLRLIFVPVIMGAVVAALVQFFFPAARGSGVNQTKAALYIYNGYISFRTVIGKFITSALALGGGFSLGPEDPSLQIGAGVASVISRRLGMSRQRLRLFAPVGAAAGLAAAFNAPISAILFVIEEVIGRWSAAVLGSVVLAAISSVVVARRFWGSEPMFQIPSVTVTDSRELLAYAVLGVIGGLAASIFSRALGYLRPRLRNLPRWTFFVQSPVAGLCVGLIGFFGFPQVMGPGYEVMDHAMHGQFLWTTLLALAFLKILATTLSFSSGTPGGMFAPTLFIGAMLGASIGTFEKIHFPNLHITVGAYALVGMGVLFAAFLRVPLTSVFMVLEVSGNYSIILPVILANTIAYLVSRSLQPSAIFEVFTHQDGLDLPSMEEQREEVVLHLEDALRPLSVPVIDANATLSAALAELDAKHADVFLIRLPGHAWYSMTRAELGSLAAVSAPETVVASVLKPDRIPLLFPDLPLDSALPHLARWPILPIQNRASRGAIEGTVTLSDVLSRYQAT
ncbi:MAG: chloride channel protein family [Acidobacteriaceae bacterium]|jgi:CIC family chloride channel protein|nr:chloride channel protein family [Acidobacteriaceae bacterium]